MIGSDACLSAVGAFQIVEDAITELMGELKIDGLTVFSKYDAFWVFAKSHIRFQKKLSWSEEYTVTAFISSASLAKMYVDVKVCGQGGEALYSKVELCILDRATQKIKKISSVGVNESMISGEKGEDIGFWKFPPCELPTVERVKVRSTNIDRSHHTNNVEYIRFIMNTYSALELEAMKIKEMEVTYCGQSFEDNVLDIMKGTNAGEDLFILQADGRPVIRCEIVFDMTAE